MNKEFNKYREKLILSTMKKLGGKSTVNEVIDYIWLNERKTSEVFRRGWRFYVHLNKFPASMERKKMIKFTGEYKQGNTKLEKIWGVIMPHKD